MKNITVITIITLFGFICSCEKQPFDFRSKFIGEYSITEEIEYLITDSSCNIILNNKEMEFFHGEIKRESNFEGYPAILIVYDDKQFLGRLSYAEHNIFQLATPEENIMNLPVYVKFSENNNEFKIEYRACLSYQYCPVGMYCNNRKNVKIKGIKK